MKRPGDGVITAMKAMLPVVFTLRCLSCLEARWVQRFLGPRSHCQRSGSIR